MRFEAKNKECKQDAQKSNFKNVCKTVAEQHQRRHSIRLQDLFCKNPVTIKDCKFVYIHLYMNYLTTCSCVIYIHMYRFYQEK